MQWRQGNLRLAPGSVVIRWVSLQTVGRISSDSSNNDLVTMKHSSTIHCFGCGNSHGWTDKHPSNLQLPRVPCYVIEARAQHAQARSTSATWVALGYPNNLRSSYRLETLFKDPVYPIHPIHPFVFHLSSFFLPSPISLFFIITSISFGNHHMK
ncbi:uncharacterized protein Bfra_005277 [Botrytis fragariae]|uniref:Uncharacterized protein n=1 Tax=Botrytis fragariae TaxID=1964551 RepID=A0A8H6EJ48_9HELO|nr:uncharacterized protein Bfra_005277 [Botrytis fragariae]KAF5873810.1 hypothetical protein Bfra_005277 [Botrytis fragariae]